MFAMCRLFALPLILLPGLAAAECREPVTYDRAQASELLAAMVSPDIAALDQLFAFEDLMCAAQPGIRELGFRTGALSENPIIRSQVLMRAVFEKEVIVIRLGTIEGMSKDQTDRVKKQPTVALTVLYRDREAGCLSFNDQTACNPASLASVFGTSMDVLINYNGIALTGSFAYDHGDELTGEVVMDRMTFPATISLF